MKIQVVAFGIARDILQGTTQEIALGSSSKISDLKDVLMKEYPAFSELRSLRFAVNEEYQDDDFELKETDEVVIIPPVSGG
ncbi:MoaD/ThiS family protein [Fulvivirga sedimenti]|uniref:Molybdopterin synthase sulfur carrier subunit n=1 Tax=Fulvivirga sedimenti TaxID=2879465 RepID=A0A9X1HNK7_9BACT|nr:MoaD/ThiS family protein [Fulvivirga sedimenti]MCA6073484.1 MoaD/ThiS family protein [Fulvivirga sedimenti]